jgi:hypothetical protein
MVGVLLSFAPPRSVPWSRFGSRNPRSRSRPPTPHRVAPRRPWAPTLAHVARWPPGWPPAPPRQPTSRAATRHPWSSCTTDRAPRRCRCRGVRHQLRAARRDRRSGRWRVGVAPVARAPVPALATPGPKHAGAEPLPVPRAVQGVVPAAVGLPGVVGAAATRAAGDDTADRAELHPRIVNRLAGAVYSLAVLRLRATRPPACPGITDGGRYNR